MPVETVFYTPVSAQPAGDLVGVGVGVGGRERGDGVDDFGVQPVAAMAAGLAGQLEDLHRAREPDPCGDLGGLQRPCRRPSVAVSAVRGEPQSVSLHWARCLSSQRLVLDSSGRGDRSRWCCRRARRC
jgi:hypothetical protein